jgi:hypothetical protein
MAEASPEMLQAMVHRFLEDASALRSDLRELKHGTGILERQVGSLTGNEAEHSAPLSIRFDDMGDRLVRIERRLDLVDTASGR